MRKLVAIFCMASLSIMFLGSAFCADENKSVSNPQQPAERIKPPRRPIPMNKSMAFILGSISKIDATAPENIKLEVLNDADGKSHVVETGTGANILKIIEVGELKAGDKVRIVARKTGDKEIAISIVTGKLKEARMPRPPAGPVPAPMVKKDQIKK